MNLDTSVIWERLTIICRDLFEDDEIVLREETSARDVEGWDSLSHIQLMVAVEKEFDIRFHTAELTGLANVGQLVALIARRMGPSATKA